MIIKTIEEAIQYPELMYEYGHASGKVYKFLPKQISSTDTGNVLWGKVSLQPYTGNNINYMVISLTQSRLNGGYVILTTDKDVKKPNTPKHIPYEEGLV